MRRLLILLLALGLALPLAACGRKSTPMPPDGAFYPYKYPYTPFPKSQADIDEEREQDRRAAARGEEFAPPEPDLTKARPFELERPAK